jgi:hypothetical protein
LAATLAAPLFRSIEVRYGNGLARLRRLIAAGVTGQPLVAKHQTHWNRLPAYYEVPGAVEGHRTGARSSATQSTRDLLTFTRWDRCAACSPETRRTGQLL